MRINKNEVLYFSFLPREYRYWGRRVEYYDGPIPCFGFWLFHVYIWWEPKEDE